MKQSLEPGLRGELSFCVPDTKTVPHLYPEAPEFQVMPRVFATGFLVGLVEWACLRVVNPHLDWPREQTVGTHVDLSHAAATPPGMTVTVKAELVAVEGRKLTFVFSAHDGADLITEGRHERFVIDAERFLPRVAAKAAAAGVAKERA
jgi:fluoroacetyl-CoA thioesterase